MSAALRRVFPAGLALVIGGALAPQMGQAQDAQHAAASCPVERALYTLPAEGGDIHAAFIPARNWPSAASNLYLKLTTAQRDYWFSFAISNGYGGISLLPVENPYDERAQDSGPASTLPEAERPEDEEAQIELLAQLRFLSMDRDLNVAENPPSAGEEAPPYLMMPELGQALWYDAALLTTDPAAERDDMPRGVFRISTCLAEAPPKAWP
ncbi:MAG: hypothetical protein BGO57_11695 [Sphingomonadales bacterium 63-6]|nr:MAG: hypothetical protein BGO57_11695 [Sphingomonadales bacterium 63-6]